MNVVVCDGIGENPPEVLRRSHLGDYDVMNPDRAREIHTEPDQLVGLLPRLGIPDEDFSTVC